MTCSYCWVSMNAPAIPAVTQGEEAATSYSVALSTDHVYDVFGANQCNKVRYGTPDCIVDL